MNQGKYYWLESEENYKVQVSGTSGRFFVVDDVWMITQAALKEDTLASEVILRTDYTPIRRKIVARKFPQADQADLPKDIHVYELEAVLNSRHQNHETQDSIIRNLAICVASVFR